MSTLDLYICLCHRRNASETRHWFIMTALPGAETGTWYHVEGGPTLKTDYKLQVQAGKRVESRGVENMYKIGTISETNVKKPKAAVQSVPLQRCQRFSVAVLAKLEKKWLVPEGTTACWEAQIEPSPCEAGPSSSLGGSSYRSRTLAWPSFSWKGV
ncbi:hypothetical protein H072_11099 [Dactylellina haptotyla CBS 200.50]|uniref:Uncharacterized protein n=1 Tax=Dactylellina haptotyla (strain CBS 200.50) TaxID=1284197 RepID=S7ZYN5_DACHA|nr:hypothetical protein H072_11099 [Dactylellina haptotyla CBS 200.50]